MAEDAEVDDSELVEMYDRLFQRRSIDNQIYCVPCCDDDAEEQRLDQQHTLFYYVLGEELYAPNIRYPSRILDCGYGTGRWMQQMAGMFPDSQIVGYDIYPFDVDDVSGQIETEVRNLNNRLRVRESEKFDFIHSRCVAAGIRANRWNGYFRDLRDMLRPGGYLQVAEYNLNFQSDSGLLDSRSWLSHWNSVYNHVMQQTFSRDPMIGRQLESKLIAQGFRSVHAEMYRLPIGAWGQNNRDDQIGRLNLENVCQLLHSHSIYPFCNSREGRRAQQQAEMEAANAEAEIRNMDATEQQRRRLYICLWVYIPIHVQTLTVDSWVAWGRR